MAGISSNALKGMNYAENRKKYNGNELQSKEFGDGAGLEWTDFNARTYDQQIGRFQQIDPWVEVGSQEMLTPYQFAFNNPIRYNDPTGRCVPCLVWEAPAIVDGIVALGAATGVTAVIYNAADKLRDLDWSQLGAGSQTTFVPHITIPQSTVRKMQSDEAANSSSNTANNQTSQGSTPTSQSPNKKEEKEGSNIGGYSHKDSQRPLPRKDNGEPATDEGVTGPHSQLGSKDGRKGTYNQAREFDENGKPVKDIDFTDHGRPGNHPNPHQHRYIPNPTGGTPQHGPAEPLTVDYKRYLPWLQQKP